MRKRGRWRIPLWTGFLAFTAVSAGPAAQDRWVWSVSDPAAHGLDPARLEEAREALAERNTAAFLVVRDGQIVFEWYASGSGPEKGHYTASLAKALVGGMSLLLVLADGRVRVDDPAWRYIPAWTDHPRKSGITVRQLATHSSGIEDAEQDGIPHMQLPGWKGEFWSKDPDPFTPAIHSAPVVFAPGTDYASSNPGMAALACVVTRSLERYFWVQILPGAAPRFHGGIGIYDAPEPWGPWTTAFYARHFDVGPGENAHLRRNG